MSDTEIASWLKRVQDVGRYILSVVGMYLVWILLNYFAAHAYVRFCVPPTIWGFLTAPFMVPAPHCQALCWAIYNGGTNIVSMWIMIGTWTSNYLQG